MFLYKVVKIYKWLFNKKLKALITEAKMPNMPSLSKMNLFKKAKNSQTVGR